MFTISSSAPETIILEGICWLRMGDFEGVKGANVFVVIGEVFRVAVVLVKLARVFVVVVIVDVKLVVVDIDVDAGVVDVDAVVVVVDAVVVTVVEAVVFVIVLDVLVILFFSSKNTMVVDGVVLRATGTGFPFCLSLEFIIRVLTFS